MEACLFSAEMTDHECMFLYVFDTPDYDRKQFIIFFSHVKPKLFLFILRPNEVERN